MATKPSTKKRMTDMMKDMAAAHTAEPEKAKVRNKEGEEIITLSLRVTRPQWESLMTLMTAERMKLQPYFKELAKADFERRGLEF